MPVDGLPYVGPLWPLSDRTLVVTGLRKWGLAMGVTASAILVDRVRGRENELADVFDTGRLHATKAAPQLVKHTGHSGRHFLFDRLLRRWGSASPAAGEGEVIRSGLGQSAVCRDADGQLHVLSARCTHLGCIVEWNPAELTWDCPCHGSRFSAAGEVLTGPATEPLAAKS
jgi:nitrite reductase/ring-hydroxylating ferredoxin subunit